MILGHPLIVYCPGCNTPHMQMNLISGNTFGGVFWSDGCSLSPMLPDIPLFTRCTSCNLIFSLKRCKQTESEDEEVFKMPVVVQPDINGLAEALTLKVHQSGQEEIYLRIRLWWALNNRSFNKGEIGHHIVDQAYRDNAIRLLNLLDVENKENLLTIAELYRNLGEFDECRKTLSGVTEKHFENHVKQIKDACNRGLSAVVRFN